MATRASKTSPRLMLSHVELVVHSGDVRPGKLCSKYIGGTKHCITL